MGSASKWSPRAAPWPTPTARHYIQRAQILANENLRLYTHIYIHTRHTRTYPPHILVCVDYVSLFGRFPPPHTAFYMYVQNFFLPSPTVAVWTVKRFCDYLFLYLDFGRRVFCVGLVVFSLF